MERRGGRKLTIRRRAFALRAVAAFALALPCIAHAQTVQLANQPFPVTTLGQTTTLALPLTIGNGGTFNLNAQIAPGYTEFAVAGIAGCSNPSGVLSGGTTCQLNITFTPQLPGQVASSVPFGRTAVLNITYTDLTTNLYTQMNYVLAGSGTGPWPVIVPGIVSVIAGNDTAGTSGFAGESAPASQAQFLSPGAVAVDNLGNIYIADTGNSVVRVIYKAGTIPNVANPVAGSIYTIAGVVPSGNNATAGFGTDGVAATQSPLNRPSGLAFDKMGNIYIVDSANNAVRMVNTATGIITTVAGTLNSLNGYMGDNGQATSAQLAAPVGIALDGNGNLYIADSMNNAIRKVNAGTGVITTVAGGSNATTASNGDGGLATVANLNLPLGVITDSAFNIYIADSQNFALRRVDAVSGLISTVQQNTNSPVNVVGIDSADNVYFGDPSACTVRKYSPFAQTVMYVAGNNACVTSGDGGSATSAGFRSINGLAVDASGNVFILQTDSLRLVDGTQTLVNLGNATAGMTVYPPAALAPTVSNLDIVSLANPGNPPWPFFVLDVGAGAGYLSLAPPFYAAPYTLATQQTPDCAANFTYQSLVPGQSCGFTLYGEPTADGAVTQTAQLRYSGHQTSTGSPAMQAISPATVNLSVTGTGNFNQLVFNPTSLAFGSIPQNSASSTLPVTLSNPGTVTINITGMSFTNTGFSLGSTTCGASLTPGANCVVNVTYAPGANDAYAATFVVKTDDANSPHQLPLSGTGPLAPYFSPSPVNFAPITSGVYGDPGTVQFFNPTPYPLQVTNTNAGYNGSFNLLVTSTTCTGSISPGSSCTFNLNFQSKDVGVESGAFAVYTSGLPSDYPSVYQVYYSATGTGSVSIPLNIHETITTNDAPVLAVATLLGINETIFTSDTPLLVRPLMLPINEVITIGDAPALARPTLLPISEMISVSDALPALLPATLLRVSETITTSEGQPAPVPSVLLPISETITVTDAPFTVAVPIATTLGLRSISPITVGTQETLTIVLLPRTAAGSVNIYQDGMLASVVALVNGGATYNTANLAVGAHSFYATYAGNMGIAASTSDTTQVIVQPIATTTALTSSLNPTTSGQSVIFTASVGASSGAASGSVLFTDGSTTLGTVTLGNGGSASYTTAMLSVGSHTITATLQPSLNFSASTASVTQLVDAPPFTLTAGSGASLSLTLAAGTNGSLNFNVTPNGSFAGTISFSCANLPANVTCTFAPLSVTIANGSTTPVGDTLSLNTQTRLAGSMRREGTTPVSMAFGLAGLLLTGLGVSRRKLSRHTLSLFGWLCLSVGIVGAVAGCGRSADINAAPGTSTFQVTATSGTTTASIPVTLTIQ